MKRNRARAFHLVWTLAGVLAVGCGKEDPAADPVLDAAADTPAAQVGGVGDGPPAVRDLAPYERLAAPPPPTGHGWTVQEVGAGGTGSGRLQVAPQGVVLFGGGADIGGAADSFVFAFRKMKGDVEILARPRFVQRADARSTAGIMVRADENDPGAASVYFGLLADPLMGGQVVHRAARGQVSVAAPADPQVRNQFLRLRREGRRFTLARSSDRSAWVKMGSVEIDMPEEVAVGLALSARSSAASGTVGDFDFVRLLGTSAGAPGEAWELDPLGLAGPLATASLQGGELTMSAVGEPFTTTLENGAALLAPRTVDSGSLSLTARVEALGDGNTPGARLALTFREGFPGRLGPTARNVLISISADGLLAFQRRDRSTNFDPGMTRTGVVLPVWLRLTRSDDPLSGRTTVSGLYSMDGSTWTTLDAVPFSIPDPTMAGVVFTSGTSARYASARATGFAISTAAMPAVPPDAGPPTGGADAAGEVGP